MEEYGKQREIDALIKFEIRSMKDEEASRAAGHTVMADVDYVVVCSKGDRSTETSFKASSLHRRDPVLWEHIKDGYARWKAGQEDPLEGTPLKGWTGCTASQMHDLFNVNIRTVEDLAEMTDAQCQKQTGFLTLRDVARNYMKAAAGPGKAAEEITALQKQTKDQGELISSLMEQLDEMRNQLNAMTPKRGKAA